MNRWPLRLIWLIEAIVVLIVIYFEPTYCVRGHLWREAFYEGRPTSYWRAELERWDVNKELGFGWMGYRDTVFRRNATPFERFRERWFPSHAPEGDWHQKVVTKALIWMHNQ